MEGANPLFTKQFASTYEHYAERITGPISREAMRLVGNVGPGSRIIDIAAGSGALSVPAAQSEAKVAAIDIAPGMVERLRERLEPYPDCVAAVMNGEKLSFPDAAFDAAFSIFGVIFFRDWRQGLREQRRVLRSGGKACVATWHTPPGGGPFVLMAKALKMAFPERVPPPIPEAMSYLSDEDHLSSELKKAGLENVQVRAVEGVWTAPAGERYIGDNEALHEYMPGYSTLNEEEREVVRHQLLKLIGPHTVGDKVQLRSTALIAVGQRPRLELEA